MSTYRVGDHHGVTIVREGDGARCGRPDHDCDRGHIVGVMLTAEDAALVVDKECTNYALCLPDARAPDALELGQEVPWG